MHLRPALIAASAAGLVVCGATLHGAYGAITSKVSTPAAKSHHVYKLDYTLNVTEEGRPAKAIALSQSIEDGSAGSIHAGANIPLQVAGSMCSGFSAPRQDVGLKLQTRVARLGTDVLLHVDLEMSGVAERTEGAVPVRKVNSDGDALVTPGTPTVVTVFDEPGTRTRYELVVTATLLK